MEAWKRRSLRPLMLCCVVFGWGLLLTPCYSQAIDAFEGDVSQNAAAITTIYQPLKKKSGPHPDFILPSIDGNSSIQLSKYRGKKVLLLHFASW
ncbi:MAG: hypothetical protein ACI814_005253 [Mariniblastus sp.]|jgi:hypothetical protein